jgi:hemoglobin
MSMPCRRALEIPVNSLQSSVMKAPQRRTQITVAIAERTGIDEAMIQRLVHAFYAKVQKDELLGPIFDSRVGSWDLHLERMCSFWSSVALMSGRYHGQPMEKHLSLPVDGRHFDHWLGLFRETALETCPAAAAAHFIERAGRIAESLELGIAGKNGISLLKGQRLKRHDAEVYLKGNDPDARCASRRDN